MQDFKTQFWITLLRKLTKLHTFRIKTDFFIVAHVGRSVGAVWELSPPQCSAVNYSWI